MRKIALAFGILGVCGLALAQQPAIPPSDYASPIRPAQQVSPGQPYSSDEVPTTRKAKKKKPTVGLPPTNPPVPDPSSTPLSGYPGAPPVPGHGQPLPPSLNPECSPPGAPPFTMEPGEMSIEQLLDAIEKTRVQKAELEKKEAAMMKELKERAAVLNKRIEKLKSPVVTERNFDSPAMDTPKPTRR